MQKFNMEQFTGTKQTCMKVVREWEFQQQQQLNMLQQMCPESIICYLHFQGIFLHILTIANVEQTQIMLLCLDNTSYSPTLLNFHYYQMSHTKPWDLHRVLTAVGLHLLFMLSSGSVWFRVTPDASLLWVWVLSSHYAM